MPRWLLLLLVPLVLLTACTSHPESGTGRHGTLLVIGGGLDDDNKPVYERFARLAGKTGTPRVVIATAASADQDAAATGKAKSLAAWCPGASIEVIRRETPTNQTVAAIDRATAMFFTGGDQKQITDRYRPDNTETPESASMRRLLDREGVIAGTSAGDAMMNRTMFLTGGSAEALGIRAKRPAATDTDTDAPAPSGDSPLGPQIAPGMGFVSWVITASHFFERNRVGRLVAALEVTGDRLGLGVGEDACVEIDLATGQAMGISVAESLLVDSAGLRRAGLSRRGLVGRVIRQGDRVALPQRLSSTCPPPIAAPGSAPQEVSVVEPGQNRQPASRWLFVRASASGSGVWRLLLDGWMITAWPDGRGEVVFDIDPSP